MAGVKTLHKDYVKFAPKWKRVRDVVAGQDAIRDAGAEYLPKLKDETGGDYKARIARSDFFNGTWRTIDALGGMAFRKAPTVKVPKAIEPYLEDINLAGMTMESLAKECTEEVLGPGRIGVLVDHPAFPENVSALTVAAAQSLGLRPTLQLYMAESIRNWKFARVNNAWVLSMVTLGECAAVPKDEFTDEDEPRYRVLDLDEAGLYRQRLYSSGKDATAVGDTLLSTLYPLMNNQPLSFIPFYILGAGGLNDKIDEPPLIDLVDKNIAHYQVNADYRHGLHFAGLPTLFLAGMDPPTEGSPKYYIGSSAAIIASHPDAKATFIEFNGQGLEPIAAALDRLERQMALLGARMIGEETKVAETFGAQQIKRQGENAVLSKIVQSVSEGLEKALMVFSQWAGQATKEISYQINRDFLPAGMDAQQLTALLAAVAAGEMSSESFFALLQRADLVASDLTFEEEQARAEIQNPAPVKPTVAPNDPQQGVAA